MLDKIESTFRDLISALQIARLYPDWHPEFKKGIDKAYSSLQEVFRDRDELVIGIVGEELAFEKEIFFDLSKTIKPAILFLKDRGIERVQFLKNLDREELTKFISFLVMPKDKISPEPDEYLNLLGVKNIAAGKIKVSGVHKTERYQEIVPTEFLQIYEQSSDKISDSLDRILNGQNLDYLILRSSITNVMQNLLGRYQELLNLAKIKRYDLRTFYHILNVSILSMYFASKLGFTKEKIIDIGIAALFHDIGKLYISRKIIQKPSGLSEEEFSRIKSHVTLGVQILLKYVDNLGILPIVVCFEHHLKYNLKGYPKVVFYKKLHIVSMIVAMCDIYDALFQRRSYKRDSPPNMIYEIMVKERGGGFEPELFDKFFKVIGVWPTGTIVALSDGRIAVVREQNEDDIFLPKVEVIFPIDKKENIDLRSREGKNKIERSLNPLGEGKDYLSLIYSP